MSDKPKFKIGANSNKDLNLTMNNFIQKGTSNFEGRESDYFMWDVTIDGTEYVIFASGVLNEMFEIAKSSVGNSCTWRFSKTPDESKHLFNGKDRKQLLAQSINTDKKLPDAPPPSNTGGNAKGDIMGALKSIEDNVSYIKGKMLGAITKGVTDDELPF